MKTVQTSAGAIHWAESGAGAPVLFSNSLGTDFRIWDRVLPLLPDGLRVIRSGITAADRIIIQGLQRARPGQPVTAQEGTIAAATQPGAGATTGQAQ